MSEDLHKRPRSWKDGAVTVSRKRLRVYPHRFDWEAARVKYANGDSISSIARELGVTWSAVKRVVDSDVYIKERARLKARMAIGNGACVTCGAPISRNYGQTIAHCVACSRVSRRTSVRDTELLCFKCKEWKPDRDFTPSKALEHRRNRHGTCRRCATIQRRLIRSRVKDEA